ncbi:MAG TPA: rhomboid family intramembrane serine protease [Candidatus Acidoferrales bacterium]|nr:rhomboid family intramembrane serine protease [Candidatus Acidoferrales bacterium]
MGIPLRDISRRPVHRPVVTIGIIAVNVFVFILELLGGNAFVQQWAVIPANIAAGQRWITILTAMFMHGSWMHIIGNMVFFWAFGPEIEDAMGPIRYLIFYLLGGLVAFGAQIAAMPASSIPNLGASGAIAAIMGAFIITYPRDRIRTLLFLGWFVTVTVLPAALLIGLWFLLQLFSEVGSVAQAQSGGVAYMAHVGGFVFGVVAGRLFESSRRIAAQSYEREI